jgi:hypothetical protein
LLVRDWEFWASVEGQKLSHQLEDIRGEFGNVLLKNHLEGLEKESLELFRCLGRCFANESIESSNNREIVKLALLASSAH